MKNTQTQHEEDIDILLKHWKEVPVISSKIFMSSFPYIQPPWDHWNKIVDKLKEGHTDSSCGATQSEVVIKDCDIDKKDCSNGADKEETVKKASMTHMNSSGYTTDVSEISDDEDDNYTTDSCVVDWESDAEF